MPVVFNRPPIIGKEFDYLRQAIESGRIAGDGSFTERCHDMIARRLNNAFVRLTHSCTAALEMAVILANVGPGDEVIMPSFTFASTANAVVLRGGVPVFVDIRADTLNIDESLIEAARTDRTRAIMPIHYAGVCAEVDAINAIARPRRILVIEDAAQAFGSTYRGTAAGILGDMACFSFHESKNVVSGEGGALVVGPEHLRERADIIREKGTNRRQFMQGTVDKYSWVDIGSSYLPSEIVAACLLAQLEAADAINAERVRLWQRYHDAFADIEGRLRRPIVPPHCVHNGHMYYVLLPTRAARDALIAALREKEIMAIFHYIPLHSAPAGRQFGRTSGDLTRTDDLSGRLLRLPLHVSLTDDAQDHVIDAIHRHVEAK